MQIEQISEFTIYEVEKLKEIFLEELQKDGDIEVDMSSVEKIDMVGIQLLLALMKSAKKVDKSVKLLNLNEMISSQIKMCEYADILGLHGG